MIDWDDMRTVLAMVREGTLAGAGAALGVNYTTVARRIRRAEDAIGEKLFERLAGGYRPTETGLLVAEHASGMESQQDDLLRQLQGRDTSLTGTLTITAPQLIIGRILAPTIERYRSRYPDVSLRVRATNELLNLHRREADLAVRISENPGDTLTGLRLCEQMAASFATPELADHLASNPDAIIEWIRPESSPDVPSEALAKYPNSHVALVTDDIVAMMGLACEGLGVVRLPMSLGRTTPGLVQVPFLPPHPYPDIWLVGHPDVWKSAKATAFRQILVPDIRAIRDMFLA